MDNKAWQALHLLERSDFLETFGRGCLYVLAGVAALILLAFVTQGHINVPIWLALPLIALAFYAASLKSNKPKLQVKADRMPVETLVDTPLHLLVERAKPGQKVGLRAHMWDRHGQKWESHALFEADGFGMVDLTKTPPLEGTYTGADGMGLFWSMERSREKRNPDRRLAIDMMEAVVDVYVDGQPVGMEIVPRKFVLPSVRREDVRENGLVGTLFYQDRRELLPAVLVLGGSEGGLAERRAALLASHGYAALALAYFNVEGLPEQLVNIPLESLEKALAFLQDHPVTDSAFTAVMGTSKGGELALLLGATFPQVNAVVAYAPSHVVFQGLGETADGRPASSWLHRGNPLPFVQGEVPQDVLDNLRQSKDNNEPVAYRDWYCAKLGDEAQQAAAAIPVERTNGPILLITGGDDQLWPAADMAEQAVARLQANDFPHAVTHLTYPEAGHLIRTPGLPATESEIIRCGSLTLRSGGSPAANEAASTDSWPKVLAFLKQAYQQATGAD